MTNINLFNNEMDELEEFFANIYQIIMAGDDSQEMWDHIDELMTDVDKIGSRLDETLETDEEGAASDSEMEEGEISEDEEELSDIEVEKITDTYWPSLKKILQEDAYARDRLSLQCAICYEDMTVRDDEHVVEHIDHTRPVTHEPCVMPCGHIIGFSCMQRMILSDWKDTRASSCPCCRLVLHHGECLHYAARMKIPWNNLDKMPLTVPEGGELQGICTDCTLQDLLHSMALLAETFVPKFHCDKKVGVRLYNDVGYADYQMSFMEREIAYDHVFNLEEFGDPWSKRLQRTFEETIENYQIMCKNAWSAVDPQSLRFKLAVYAPNYDVEFKMPPDSPSDVGFLDGNIMVVEDMRG